MARKKAKDAAMSRSELSLEGDLTIYTATQQREALLAWVVSGTGSGVVDLSHVLDCDSAGLQLLLATRASLAEQGCSMTLGNPSTAVREVLKTYALGEDLFPLNELGQGAAA